MPVDLGGQVLGVAVHGAAVEVVRSAGTRTRATNVATRGDAVVADPLRLLDGLTGRVPLDEVLPAPDDVRAALGLLAPSI